MSEPLAAGTRIGGYRIVRLLGEGGVGAVHEAVHDGLDKRVAIKTLHASALASPDAVQRFVREGKIAAKIRHPHVVDVTDVGVENGTPYLVMELLDGLSLSDFVEGQGPMPLEALLEIALPIVDALVAAHDEGVVHRDLKPDNVFLVRTRTGDLHPKLLDFGISKMESVDARLTATTTMMGTPYYMSPEQARGAKNVDARSDQFSFGLVLQEMATGSRPIDGDSLLEVIHKISTVDVPSLAQLRPDLPPPFVAVVARALAINPDERFGSMRELGAALLALAGPHARAVWERAFAGVTVSVPPRSSKAIPTAFASTVSATTPLTTTGETEVAPRKSKAGAIAAVVVVLGVGGAAVAAFGPWSLWRGDEVKVGPPTFAATATVSPSDPEPAVVAPPSDPEPAVVAPPSDPEPAVVAPPSDPEPAVVAPPSDPEPAVVAPPSPAPDESARVAVGRHTRHVVPSAPETLPVTLTPQDVNQVLLPFNRPVAACNNGPHGVARVSFLIEGATGRIKTIDINGPFNGSAVRNCIAGVLHTAHFPRFASPTHAVMFPFAI